MIRRLASPANANIPKTDNIHNIRKTEAIARKGLGKIPIIAAITTNVRRFHSVIGCELMANNVVSGIERPLIWIYPKNHKMISIISSPVSIFIL